MPTEMMKRENLGDTKGIRTHNHLVCKRTVNRLAKLALDLQLGWSSNNFLDTFNGRISLA